MARARSVRVATQQGVEVLDELTGRVARGDAVRVAARVAANWTVAGLLAHESAMLGGEVLDMPDWALF